MRHYGLFWGEFGADLVGVKYCSHTLLLHVWVSVRRARAHPVVCAWDYISQKNPPRTRREYVARAARRDALEPPQHGQRPTKRRMQLQK